MQCVSWTSNSLTHFEAKDNDEVHEDKEETWEPEEHHTNEFNIFDNFDDEPSL